MLANDIEDTAGTRAGVRGYAYPDLLLQLAVTHDEIFATNTTFSLTWFIGRTRTNFHPACGVLDRFREPVMRNDYVVLSQSTALGGTPLTDADGSAFRVVHVDSNAPPGGDGTFERPLNNLDDIDDNSQARRHRVRPRRKRVQRHSRPRCRRTSDSWAKATASSTRSSRRKRGRSRFRSRRRAAVGCRGRSSMAALGDAVTIGDLNEVANFTINGGTGAIVAGPSGRRQSKHPRPHDHATRRVTPLCCGRSCASTRTTPTTTAT